MKSPAQTIHDAVQAVCPLDGCAIGDPTDKATWRFDYAASATGAQKVQAAAVIQAFDVAKYESDKAAIVQIEALEAAITPRRLREAMLGLDNDWLKGVNSQIATLRAGL